MYKIVIVEDESGARNFVERFINKEIDDITVVGSFANGQEASDFLKSNSVDIVITDIKMPKVDGMSLAREIYEKYPDTSVIIISGYGEFEYAKKAIEYNVKQYILKPIDFEELITAMNKIKDELHKKSSAKPAAWECERFFTDLVMGAFSNEEQITEHFQALGLGYDIKSVSGRIYKINILNYDETFSEHWKYDKSSFERAFFNLINSSCDIYKVYPVVRHDNTFFVVTMFISQIDDFENRIMEILRECMQIDISVQPVSNKEALYNLSLHSAEEWLIDDELKLVISYLMVNNVSAASNVLKKITKNDKKEHGEVYDVIDKYNTENDNDVIEKAKRYIENNYDKDITRDDVANYVFFNPVYFGRYFKGKVGVSINDYLLNLRMNKAIELLSTNMKVSDISKAVGYNNLRNFQRTLKMYTGYSSTEYRRTVLNIDFDEESE